MRILHLISQHPESTGSGYYIQNIIRQAAVAGHQNFLVAGVTGNRLPDLDCIDECSCRFVHFEKGQLDYVIPGMSDVMPYPSSRFGALTSEQLRRYEQAFVKAMGLAFVDFCPDIIHSHHLWLASGVARELFPTLPMVTSCHSSDLRQLVQCPHLAPRVIPPCREIDRILALSGDQVEKIHRFYSIPHDRIDIVGGGYDETLFALQHKGHVPPVEMLYAGKLSFSKGVDLLLESFRAVAGPDIHLHIAGSGAGSESRKCLEIAEAAGSTVTVHGRINQQELAGLMGRCHVFILPSFYEGLPLVLLEALAAGCRIITTTLPGCEALLDEAGEDLVEFVKLPVMQSVDRPAPTEVPSFQKRLEAAIQSMAKRVQQSPAPRPEQFDTITTPYSWRAVFSRISSAYEEAMSS